MQRSHFAILFLSAVVISGCDPIKDRKYRVEGVGTDLMSQEIVDSYAIQQRYINLICSDSQDLLDFNAPHCDTKSFSSDQWHDLVAKGLNNIEKVCFDYLTWIDEKRGESAFYNQSGTALGALITGILGITDPRSRAISYISLGLGFGNSMYSAYNNLILIGMDSNTIGTIVENQQLDFRAAFNSAVYRSQPDAIYALQRFMRICTPYSIKMNINKYSQAASNKDLNKIQENKIKERNVLSPAFVSSDTVAPKPGDAAQPSPRSAPRYLTPEDLRKVFIGEARTVADLKVVQTAFCITGSDLGRVTQRTLAGIVAYEQSAVSAVKDGKIDTNEFDKIAGGTFKNCDASKYKNYFEYTRFSRDGDIDRSVMAEKEKAINIFIRKLYPEMPADKPLAFGSPEFRKKIAEIRARLKIVDPGAFSPGEVTPPLFEALEKIAP